MNANALRSLLGDEGKRWVIEMAAIEKVLSKTIGNVLLSTCQMNYLGPFSGSYRLSLMSKWMALCDANEIDVSPDYSLVQIISSNIQVREWNISGLPSDQVSIENAIFTMHGERWPLLIDPQFQGNNWLKKLHKVYESRDPERTF